MKLHFYTNIQQGYEKIASKVRCSKSTAIYWVKKYRENKDLSDEQPTHYNSEARRTNSKYGEEGI